MATEEISFNVVKEEGDIQIRAYDEAVAAVVEVEGERRDSISRAFRILFDYIGGNNMAAKEIAMTAPVSQEKSSQEIPMTTPVSQIQSADGKWQVAFYMPNDFTYSTTPKPLDERVEIKRVASKQMAAIVFSGRGSDENLAEHEQILREYLKDNNLKRDSTPLYAFYDHPLVPWFMRRNEVLFELR